MSIKLSQNHVDFSDHAIISVELTTVQEINAQLFYMSKRELKNQAEKVSILFVKKAIKYQKPLSLRGSKFILHAHKLSLLSIWRAQSANNPFQALNTSFGNKSSRHNISSVNLVNVSQTHKSGGERAAKAEINHSPSVSNVWQFGLRCGSFAYSQAQTKSNRAASGRMLRWFCVGQTEAGG